MYACVLPLPRQEEAMKMAGVDVHKKVLMVVVVDTSAPEEKPVRRRFVTLPSELQRFRIWLQAQRVEAAVMESTAQYWRSVWLELEPHMRLHLAQPHSHEGAAYARPSTTAEPDGPMVSAEGASLPGVARA